MGKTKDRNFLFELTQGKDGLKQNQSRILSTFFCTLILIFLLMDIIGVLFYYKTNARIQAMMDHSFTKSIKQSIERSKEDHKRYEEQAQTIIKEQNLDIQHQLDNLQIYYKKLLNVSSEQITIDSINQLRQKVLQLKSNPENEQYTLEVNQNFEQLNKEMENLQNTLENHTQFYQTNKSIETKMSNLVGKIRDNLGSFLLELDNLSEAQNKNQKELAIRLEKNLNNFHKMFYQVIYKDSTVALNQIYDTKFYKFDRDYVTLENSPEEGVLKAQISFDNSFNIRLPRIYYCNFNAFVYSDREFRVKFQFVERENENFDEEQILFETHQIQGNFINSRTYNNMHIIDLPAGQHTLYMKIISDPISTNIHLKDLGLRCLSYRQFVAADN